MEKIRLQKVIAASGVASRRQAERMVKDGHVSVNNVIVSRLGTKVDPQIDEIRINGALLPQRAELIYIMMNKPRAVMVTTSDPQSRTTIMDVLGDFAAQHGVNRIFPIGRLDYHTTGLLLLTNDGNLAWTLTHPSNCVPRVYHAQIRGRITMSILHELVRGVKLDATWAKALDAYVIKHNHNSSLVEVSVVEGRTRLVRRMFAALGYLVMKLKRVAYGGIALGELRSGQIRKLSTKEIAVLKHWQTLTIQKSL